MNNRHCSNFEFAHQPLIVYCLIFLCLTYLIYYSDQDFLISKQNHHHRCTFGCLQPNPRFTKMSKLSLTKAITIIPMVPF